MTVLPFFVATTRSVFLPVSEWRHPAEAGGREVLAVAVFYADGFAVDEELGGVAVGVDLDHLLLAFGSPSGSGQVWP